MKKIGNFIILFIFLSVFLSMSAASVQAAANENNITSGTLMVLTNDSQVQGILEFPLEHTDVVAEISGFVARVEVTQKFTNPYSDRIEAIYVFPLPQNAAVDDMIMKVGNRTIRGVIKTREEAKKIYEDAKNAGKIASLLEQERPNIFTQSVANIMPGDEILITIRYIQTLKYDDGGYEFVFPMVVGPRYIPGSPTGKQAGGWAPDTDKVPDASRITPPVLKPGMRSGHDISLKVSLDSGVPIQDIRSKSHDVHIETEGKSKAYIILQENDSIPNKDFILNYDVAGKKPEFAILTHRTRDELGESSGFFTLMIQPQAEFENDEITPKEMVFVVDCSGSMSGKPMEKAKEAMRHSIRNMNPNDSFQIIRFSSSASKFSPKPLPNTEKNVEKGLEYINAMSGSGGTRMIEGIKASLSYPNDPEKMRIVLFMTDGYIGNEEEILAAIEDMLGDSRLFSFGVGSSVNRYLLERMAEAGRGTVQYVRPDEDTDFAVSKFYERISNPYLTDISIDWDGLDVDDVYPKRIPDLFSAQPVLIHGRYTTPGSGKIRLIGNIAGKESITEIDVEFPKENEENAGLVSIWARTRVNDLMNQMYHGENPGIVEEITNIGLEFRIMTKYTSFVAVEEKITSVDGGPPKTVMVPVEMPEGVSYEGVFGHESEDMTAMVGGYKSMSRPSAVGGYVNSAWESVKGIISTTSSISKTGDASNPGGTTSTHPGVNVNGDAFPMGFIIIAGIFVSLVIIIVVVMTRPGNK